MNNKILMILIIIMFLTKNILSFETKEEIKNRFDFYKDIYRNSNKKMSSASDKYKGLHCKAEDYIKKGEVLIEVHKKYSICPFELFPFKFEITDAIRSIKGMEDTLGKQQKVGIYVLVFHLMYHLYGNKEYIKNYVYENKIEAYYNSFNSELKDIDKSFPKIMLGKPLFTKFHFDYLHSKLYSNENTIEIDGVYSLVLRNLSAHPHFIAMYHWLFNLNNFKHAYGIIISRAMTIRISDYNKVINNEEIGKNFDEHQKKNGLLNKKMCDIVGCPCIVLFVDLCNHYQPKYKDGRDKTPISLVTKKDFFLNLSPRDYDIDDEISYSYINEPSSYSMYMHYGFIIQYNIFNLMRLNLDLQNKILSAQKQKICNEVKCFERSETETQNFLTFKNFQVNDNLLNYGKVEGLTKEEEANSSSVIKNLILKQSLSLYNDIYSWIYYIKFVFNHFDLSRTAFLNSIKESQFYRHITLSYENNWKDTESQRQEWIEYKTFQQINDLDISYKTVILSQTIGSTRNLIKILHEDNMRIKNILINGK